MNKFFGIVLVASAISLSNQANAQVNLQVNIGSTPRWIPSSTRVVNYYYLPEIQSYYDVPSRQFIVLEGNNWVRRKSLPTRYRSYNLYSGRKVVVKSLPRRDEGRRFASYNHHGPVRYDHKNIQHRPERRKHHHGHGKGRH